MAPKFFVGIDISKITLDITVIQGKEILLQSKIENSVTAIKDFLKTQKLTKANSILCAENMGIFSTFLLNVCETKKLNICMENPLQIKRSLGIERNKNDALDALRIAKYAQKNIDSLRLWSPPRDCIRELKFLLSLRKRFLKMRVQLAGGDKIDKYCYSAETLKVKSTYIANIVSAVSNSEAAIETKMLEIIMNDSILNRQYRILNSIPHIGKIIALYLIAITNEFRDFPDARKFASYCGIAPFEYSSGTSVIRKRRVSHIANKEIKALLHLAALGYARRPNSTIGKYYKRKVAEGKNKMSVLNAVRNKIIQLAFHCVKTDQEYIEGGKFDKLEATTDF